MRRARADGRDNDRDVTSEPPSGESEGTMCARPLNEEYSAPSYLAHSQATSRTPSVPVHTDDQGRIARQPANLDASGLRSSARRRWLPASLRKRFVVPSPAAEASAAARSGGRVWSGGWSTECRRDPKVPMDVGVVFARLPRSCGAHLQLGAQQFACCRTLASSRVRVRELREDGAAVSSVWPRDPP